MAIEMKVPPVGESITEVTIASWNKKDGDIVKMDEVLCELESDKATFELPAEAEGVLRIVAKEGDVLVFSAVNLEPLKRRISAEDLSLSLLVVKMEAKEIELKEVIVNDNYGITAENLGIVPHGQKTYTPAERKLRTASGMGITGNSDGTSGVSA